MQYNTEAVALRPEVYLVGADGNYQIQHEVAEIDHDFCGYTWVTLVNGETHVFPNDQIVRVNESAYDMEYDRQEREWMAQEEEWYNSQERAEWYAWQDRLADECCI